MFIYCLVRVFVSFEQQNPSEKGPVNERFAPLRGRELQLKKILLQRISS